MTFLTCRAGRWMRRICQCCVSRESSDAIAAGERYDLPIRRKITAQRLGTCRRRMRVPVQSDTATPPCRAPPDFGQQLGDACIRPSVYAPDPASRTTPLQGDSAALPNEMRRPRSSELRAAPSKSNVTRRSSSRAPSGFTCAPACALQCHQTVRRTPSGTHAPGRAARSLAEPGARQARRPSSLERCTLRRTQRAPRPSPARSPPPWPQPRAQQAQVPALAARARSSAAAA